MINNYYYNRIKHVYQIIIPKGVKILYYGSIKNSFLQEITDNKILCINPFFFNPLELTNNSNIEISNCRYEEYITNEKFDYIILDNVLNQSLDICKIFQNIITACKTDTRIIIHQQNCIWKFILNIGSKLNLKLKENSQNSLSQSEIKNYISALGFEHTRSFQDTIFPLKLFGIGHVLNRVFSIIPLFGFLKLDQYIIVRPLPNIIVDYIPPNSVTICITVRNEKGNIEPMIKSLPILCNNQEILFVEGHSTDGTSAEIQRMITMYPEKQIRLIGQPGIGQGDAIHVGFKEAKGEIIILYEGDGTSIPEDVHYFYQAIKNGKCEFIEGSRFVYPFDKKCMPFLNKIGNIFFAYFFTIVLKQKITDVLSGIKAITREGYKKVYIGWGEYGIQDPFGDFELLFGSVRYGLKMGELPMRYVPRPYGKSKTKVIKDGLKLLYMTLIWYYNLKNFTIKKKSINL